MISYFHAVSVIVTSFFNPEIEQWVQCKNKKQQYNKLSLLIIVYSWWDNSDKFIFPLCTHYLNVKLLGKMFNSKSTRGPLIVSILSEITFIFKYILNYLDFTTIAKIGILTFDMSHKFLFRTLLSYFLFKFSVKETQSDFLN